MIKLIGALFSWMGPLSKMFERKQLIDVGKKLSKGAYDAATLKNIRKAHHARRNTDMSDDSLLHPRDSDS